MHVVFVVIHDGGDRARRCYYTNISRCFKTEFILPIDFVLVVDLPCDLLGLRVETHDVVSAAAIGASHDDNRVVKHGHCQRVGSR